MNLTTLNSRSLLYSEKDLIKSIQGAMAEWEKIFTTFSLTKDKCLKFKKKNNITCIK